jgi:hypothetical protein
VKPSLSLALPDTSTGNVSQSSNEVPSTSQILDSASNAIDKAAKQSDRWWFFALLVVGIAWTGWNQWKQDEQLKLRDAKLERIEEKFTSTLTTIINDNTRAFQANTELLRRVEMHLVSPR